MDRRQRGCEGSSSRPVEMKGDDLDAEGCKRAGPTPLAASASSYDLFDCARQRAIDEHHLLGYCIAKNLMLEARGSLWGCDLERARTFLRRWGG